MGSSKGVSRFEKDPSVTIMTPAGFPRPARILGLDFSGAVNAGRKIWLTSGQVAGDALHVTRFRNSGICR